MERNGLKNNYTQYSLRKKSMLMYSVAGGVAFGIALGVGKIVFGFDLATVLIPLYLFAVVLTYFSTEELRMDGWGACFVRKRLQWKEGARIS